MVELAHCAGLAQVALHSWQIVDATPLALPLVRGCGQLGWGLSIESQVNHPIETCANPKLVCPTPRGRLRGTSHGYSTHERSFLSHLSFIPFGVDFISGMHLRIQHDPHWSTRLRYEAFDSSIRRKAAVEALSILGLTPHLIYKPSCQRATPLLVYPNYTRNIGRGEGNRTLKFQDENLVTITNLSTPPLKWQLWPVTLRRLLLEREARLLLLHRAIEIVWQYSTNVPRGNRTRCCLSSYFSPE